MKMSEYTRGEWKKMKDQPLKVRLAYFWDYYKWPTIVAVLLVIALAYTVTVRLNQKEAVLSGILINSSMPLEDPAFLQEFCQETGVDTKKQELSLLIGLSLEADNPSVGIMTYQRIHAGVAAQDTDFLIATADAFRQCAYDTSNMMMDLREFLSPEQLEQLEGRLYYIDASLFEKISNGEVVEYPSPYAPQKMEQPIAVGINIRDCEEFLDSYYYTDDPVYFAVICNTPHPDRTLQFFEFIMEEINKE